MSIFLAKMEIEQQAGEIRRSFERLLSSKRVAPRPRSRQWTFLRHCFDVLMGEAEGDFPCDERTAAQYKFEVSDKLRRYYLSPGEPVSFIFSLAHRGREGEWLPEDYPGANGYVLLVTRNAPGTTSQHETAMVLERVVADAVDAEWAVYVKLPELDLSPLEGVFDSEGSAYKRIRMTAESHHRKGWIISNPQNPSTRRLVDVKVDKILPASARARTQEYWYLRWWSIEKNKYVYIYNEMNRQAYFLVRRGDSWLVRDNFYPRARTSTPLRWRNR